MEERIGELAGEVFDHLKEQEQNSVTAVSRAVDAPQTKVNMAIGWLAREGKLDFVSEGRGTSIQLLE
jgi:predicted transcriptional regulator